MQGVGIYSNHLRFRQVIPVDGWVHFKFGSKSHTLERFFISIQSSDFYCYENESKQKIKFMHSLIGCFPVEPTKDGSYSDAVYEEADG